MKMTIASLTMLAAAGVAGPAIAQTTTAATTGSITLYELPAYLGRSVTITTDTPDLAAQTFAKRAQSARVTGSWDVCPTAGYAGTCRTLTANTPLLTKSQVVSIRPTGAATATTATSTTAVGTTASSTIDLDTLDVTAGTEGQDVSFYARPTLGGTEIAAGTNDITAATAFCKIAGATSASYAGRARVQASNLIDLSTKTRIRGFALRDVVCKR